MKCSVFIDESGEAGIAKVRDSSSLGASPYFVLAAAVMPSATAINARQVLSEIESELAPKTWRHATDLNHMQTVYFCKRASRINLRFFAVISNKATLGSYGKEIEWNPQKFYNKCTHYLLECVGKYVSSISSPVDPPDVFFEDRNHDFDRLIRFIGKAKDRPLHASAAYLKCFNPFSFLRRQKDEEPLLKFADLCAHSVYQCVNKIQKNFGITEPRYFLELSNRFGCDLKGRVLGTGLKCIHSIEMLNLDPEIAKVFEGARAMPPSIQKHSA